MQSVHWVSYVLYRALSLNLPQDVKQDTHLLQFLTYTLNNCLLSFMVFVLGSVTIIYYGLAPGLVVPIATQQGRWLMWWGARLGVQRRGYIATFFF